MEGNFLKSKEVQIVLKFILNNSNLKVIEPTVAVQFSTKLYAVLRKAPLAASTT